jgi:hypothetical protein
VSLTVSRCLDKNYVRGAYFLYGMSYYTRSRALLERKEQTMADSRANIPVNALSLEDRVAFEMNQERAEWEEAQVYARRCRRIGWNLTPLLLFAGTAVVGGCLRG